MPRLGLLIVCACAAVVGDIVPTTAAMPERDLEFLSPPMPKNYWKRHPEARKYAVDAPQDCRGVLVNTNFTEPIMPSSPVPAPASGAWPP
jgi:hypothetical protein